MKAKAISANIFKSKFGSCSNHGISEKFDEVLLLHDDGYIDVDLDDPPENLCVIERRVLFGKEADYVRPFAKPEGVAGPMYGGCLVDSSDSRFESDHPLKLHDRFETWEEYELYSS